MLKVRHFNNVQHNFSLWLISGFQKTKGLGLNTDVSQYSFGLYIHCTNNSVKVIPTLNRNNLKIIESQQTAKTRHRLTSQCRGRGNRLLSRRRSDFCSRWL